MALPVVHTQVTPAHVTKEACLEGADLHCPCMMPVG